MPQKFSFPWLLILIIAFWVLVLIRIFRNKLAPVRTVPAQVIDKHKAESFSKYSGTGKETRYVVVFLVDGKKKSFYVSEFSYGGYRLKEKGTLEYKGDRLIGFH